MNRTRRNRQPLPDSGGRSSKNPERERDRPPPRGRGAATRPDEFIYSLEAPARLSESQLDALVAWPSSSGICRKSGVHGEVKLDSSEVTAGEAKLELSASAEVGHLPLTNCIRGAQVLEDAACAWGSGSGALASSSFAAPERSDGARRSC